MDSPFKTVALIGKPHHEGPTRPSGGLYQYQTSRGFASCWRAGSQTLGLLGDNVMDLGAARRAGGPSPSWSAATANAGAARVLSRFDVAVIGVNQGNLRLPHRSLAPGLPAPLEQVLSGHFKSEHRFLAGGPVIATGERKSSNLR